MLAAMLSCGNIWEGKAFPEKSGHFFICGEAGEKDSMGLPEKIMVCPAYGLDGFAVYKKDRDYDAPEW